MVINLCRHIPNRKAMTLTERSTLRPDSSNISKIAWPIMQGFTAATDQVAINSVRRWSSALLYALYTSIFLYTTGQLQSVIDAPVRFLKIGAAAPANCHAITVCVYNSQRALFYFNELASLNHPVEISLPLSKIAFMVPSHHGTMSE